MSQPTIVCLCGSTRFVDEFRAAALSETLAGRIVLTVGSMIHSDDEHFKDLDPTVAKLAKTKLDRLHFHKIDLADEILVLNKCQYVGSSTQAEVAYAFTTGKTIRWLEPPRFWDSLSPVEKWQLCSRVLVKKHQEFMEAGISHGGYSLDTGIRL